MGGGGGEKIESAFIIILSASFYKTRDEVIFLNHQKRVFFEIWKVNPTNKIVKSLLLCRFIFSTVALFKKRWFDNACAIY